MTEHKILSDVVERSYFAPMVLEPPPPPKRPSTHSSGDTQRVLSQAEAEGVNLEKISDMNSIRFYHDFFKKGDFRGLSTNTRLQLIRTGLIARERFGGACKATPKGEALLREVEGGE